MDSPNAEIEQIDLRAIALIGWDVDWAISNTIPREPYLSWDTFVFANKNAKDYSSNVSSDIYGFLTEPDGAFVPIFETMEAVDNR